MDGGRGARPGKRRVMVVADPGRESAGALEWALYHAVLERDEIILLHVEPPSSQRGCRGSVGGSGSGSGSFSFLLRRPSSLAPGFPAGVHVSSSADGGGSGGGVGDYEFLEAMRAACEAAQPKVKVQIERVETEGKDKAATILSQTRLFRIDLLVIGQRTKPSSFLGCKLSGSSSSKGQDPAEILIENSKCLCVGVQKKGQKAGYLLNTKTHKNFWLLA